MTRTDLHRGLVILHEAFPHREVTDSLASVYWMVLHDLTEEEFTRAVRACVASGTFFPVPAEIRKHARPEPSTAEIAQVVRQIESLSEYDPHDGPCWSAKRIEERLGVAAAEAFRACGGSPAFRTLDQGNNRVHFLLRFAEAYRDRTARDDQVAILGPVDDSVQTLAAGLARRLSAGPDRTPQ
jgi:hypothetical protein